MSGLTSEERETLAPFAEDAMVFSAGASAESLLGVRDGGPSEWALEFVQARFAVEVEAIVAARLADAEARAEAAEAKVARVEKLADDYDARAASMAPEDDWGESIEATLGADTIRAVIRHLRQALRGDS